MRKNCLRRKSAIAITVLLLAAAVLQPFGAVAAEDSTRPFNDVPKNAWYYNDVYNSYYKGVFRGSSGHEFSPEAAVTRGMFVTVLYRLAGSPEVGGSTGFRDVSETAYYKKAVIWATENKIAEGYPDGCFYPEAELTREQAAKLIYNFDKNQYGTEPVNDTEKRAVTDLFDEDIKDLDEISDWAVEYLLWTNLQGLITGRQKSDGVYIAPQGKLTRAEACAILNRFCVTYMGISMKEYGEKIDFQAIASLDNTRKDYWFGTSCDSLNRPAEAVRFQGDEGQRYNALAVDTSSAGKVIYLTFDEGYEAGYTGKILDVLESRNVDAVFFITGAYYEKSKSLVKRMIEEGHIVGNHSYSHPAAGTCSLSIEGEYQEINKLQSMLRNDLNYEMTLFRSPAGIYSERTLALLTAMNMKAVYWSFAYGDYDTANQPARASALQKLKSRLHPGAVYLLHAVSATNTAILGEFIDYARSQGYTFELISNSL